MHKVSKTKTNPEHLPSPTNSNIPSDQYISETGSNRSKSPETPQIQTPSEVTPNFIQLTLGIIKKAAITTFESIMHRGGSPGDHEAGIQHVESDNKTNTAKTTLQAVGHGFAARKGLGKQSAAQEASKGRSLKTDLMLGELSAHNREKALKLAQKSRPEEAANLYNLLLEHETTLDPILHTLSRNLLLEYITANPDLISHGPTTVLHLSPDFYALYQKLNKESIGTEHSKNLQEAIPFLGILKGSVSTENVVMALVKSVNDYHAEVSLPTLTTKSEITFNWLKEGIMADKIDLNRRTYVLAYIATSLSAEKQKNYSGFMKATEEIASNLKQKTTLNKEEKTFMSIYRVLEYRNSLSAAKNLSGALFLGSHVSKEIIEEKLKGLKAQYYQTKFPFTQGTIDVQQTGANNAAKIHLDSSKSFADQMHAAGKSWDLITIINLAKKEGLPKSFLNKFDDLGFTLIQKFIYPELIKTHPDAASAEELLGLLPAHASDADKAELLLNTIRFSQEELAGAPIRKDQIIEILSKMTSLSNKPAYIIQAAGKGKSTMARFAAKVLLKNVPFILFISPFKESRPGTHELTSLKDLKEAQATDGKPVEFYVTASDYAKMLAEAPIEEVEKLRKGLHIADEFDSDQYGGIHDILEEAGITRIANMSATDNDLRLINTLERKKAKLSEITEELAQNPRQERLLLAKAALEASILEIKQNIDAEFERSMTVTTNLDVISSVKTASPGQSILILHPDESDADSLATEYEEKLGSINVAILYRNNAGELKARLNNAIIDFKEFNTIFKTKIPQPAVCCLYTKDSRGGDFGPFSRQDKGQTHVIQQHIVLKNIRSTNELYQFLRRLRRNLGADLSTVILTIHIAQEGISKETLLASAKQLNDEASKKTERTRLNNKVRRNIQQFIARALNEKWADIQAKFLSDNLEFKVYCNQETYNQAIQEVLDTVKLDPKSDPTVIYADIQRQVNTCFLKLVHQKHIQENTKDWRQQIEVLKNLHLKDIWNAGTRDQSFVAIWTQYLKKKLNLKELTESQALKFGEDLGILNAKFANHTAPKSWTLPTYPTIFTSFIHIRSKEIEGKENELSKKIKDAEQNQTFFERLEKFVSTEASLNQLPESLLSSKELKDVRFYQIKLKATI